MRRRSLPQALGQIARPGILQIASLLESGVAWPLLPERNLGDPEEAARARGTLVALTLHRIDDGLEFRCVEPAGRGAIDLLVHRAHDACKAAFSRFARRVEDLLRLFVVLRNAHAFFVQDR